MNSKFYLLSGMSLLALAANGQQLKLGYIEDPDGQKLPQQVASWVPGTPLFEDENFYISRVKAKPVLERNTAIQIFENINDANEKRLLLWVPIGNSSLNGTRGDAKPSGIFDSEVFSTWSYVTHFGDWISPYGWILGGFADVAHKNGVAVSGVASVPNASMNSSSNTGWYNCMTGMGKIDVEKLGKFLIYHGVNGLGYNSEWTTDATTMKNLQAMHTQINQYMADKDPLFENIWYDGVTNTGQCSFPDHLNTNNQENFGDAANKRTNFFLNYNWNTDYKITTSEQTAAALGRSMLDLYAGMNMQGGCKTSTEWIRHLTTNYSIGLWGAHDFNYFWAGRSKNGSSAESKQATYQRQLEHWFSNGKRNPANKVDVYKESSLAVTDKWFGMSHYLAARTTLGWDLTDEPFVTYFNLGNGKFFNLEGERQHNSEWYNISVQDYMPTWRFWFASEFLGKNPENVPATGLDAEFTWDDAWFGGSALRIFGSTDDEYLHLFRTGFELKRNDVITVRYKVRKGQANMNLALSVEGAEDKIIRETSTFKALTADDDTDEMDWVVKTFKLTGPAANEFNNKKLAMIALHFTDAADLDLLLGEISIKRGEYATPVAPVITKASALAFNRHGIDAKVIFNMPNNKPVDEVCYNSDVNASMFRIYTQQKGEEPVLMAATTSWAGIAYAAPANLSGERSVRVGVQAVGLDMVTTSDITWSDYMATPDYESEKGIQCNKSTIKPEEEFELSFIDPLHASAEWSIVSRETGKEVANGNGTTFKCSGLKDLGSYDVVVNPGTADAETYVYYLLVSAWDKGALPQITKLTVNDEEATEAPVAISLGTDVLLGYEGRESDGQSSRAIQIDENFVGANIGDLGLQPKTSFGAAAWLKMNYPDGGSALFQIENRAGSWPANNWGWCWFDVDKDGYLNIRFRGTSKELSYVYDPIQIPENAWTHIAFSFEYADGNFRLRLWLNGQEQTPLNYGQADGGGGTVTGNGGIPSTLADGWIPVQYPIASSDWLSFGGGRGSQPLYNNGMVDDVVIWDGAVTENDVKLAMEGLSGKTLPENVRAFWSFEKDFDADDYTFASEGKVNAPLSNFKPVATGEEGKGIQTPQYPLLSAGSPTLKDSGFKVVSTPSWSAPRAVVSEAEGTHTSGKAKVSYKKAGDHIVTLTLTNALGSDSKDYPVLTASQGSAVDAFESDMTAAYTVDDAIIVEFGETGNYTVAVYNVEGKAVAQKTANVAAGSMMTLSVRQAGVYMVSIAKDGQVIRTVKLLKK